MNPLKRNGNDPENYLELTLDINKLNLQNFPSLTLFFYIKIYGFTNERIEEYNSNPSANNIFEIIELNNDAANSLKLSYVYEIILFYFNIIILMKLLENGFQFL